MIVQEILVLEQALEQRVPIAMPKTDRLGQHVLDDHRGRVRHLLGQRRLLIRMAVNAAHLVDVQQNGVRRVRDEAVLPGFIEDEFIDRLVILLLLVEFSDDLPRGVDAPWRP